MEDIRVEVNPMQVQVQGGGEDEPDVSGEYVDLHFEDQIGLELTRIGIIQPGHDFVEKPAQLRKARFYRPCALFTLFLVVMSTVMGVYLYDKHTGLTQAVCQNLSRAQLIGVSWTIIIIAVIIGVFGAYIIYAVPTRSCYMNALLKVLPMEHCILTDIERQNILPGCQENKLLDVRLAGSAGDGFGCFFGQNGNIGLNKSIDYCQDLDINVVYIPKNNDEYTFKTTSPGLMSITLNKPSPLSDFKVSEGARLVSATRILEKMKSVLPKQIRATKSSIVPPATRIEKKVTVNGKLMPVQYDYVFSVLANEWPSEGRALLDRYECLNDVQIYVVPKPWKSDAALKNDVIWRYAFTEAEKALFEYFSNHHRMLIKCYIILKFIIKFEKVSRFPQSKCMIPPEDTEDEKALKSFYLKTIFLHIADEMENRRIAALKARSESGGNLSGNVNGSDPSAHDYRFYGSLDELYTSLSYKISPRGDGGEDNLGFGTDETHTRTGTSIDFEQEDNMESGGGGRPVRYTNRILSVVYNTVRGKVTPGSNPGDLHSLTNDDLFCLILDLYSNAMEKRSLKHFFIRDMNLLLEVPEEKFEEGVKSLKTIREQRVQKVLDYQDLWANRILMQCSYVFSMFALLGLFVILGLVIAGSAYLMGIDMNTAVCPLNLPRNKTIAVV